MLDITSPRSVEIEVRADGKVVWINIDGECALRACRIGTLEIIDGRSDRHNGKSVRMRFENLKQELLDYGFTPEEIEEALRDSGEIHQRQ